MSTTATGATGTSAQQDQCALMVDQRVALRRKLEELAALEADRAERGAVADLEPLDSYAIGIRDDVHDALVKLIDGTYGSCETCRSPIPAVRLKAIPYARRCLDCQEREENEWDHVQRLVGGVEGER